MDRMIRQEVRPVSPDRALWPPVSRQPGRGNVVVDLLRPADGGRSIRQIDPATVPRKTSERYQPLQQMLWVNPKHAKATVTRNGTRKIQEGTWHRFLCTRPSGATKSVASAGSVRTVEAPSNLADWWAGRAERIGRPLLSVLLEAFEDVAYSADTLGQRPLQSRLGGAGAGAGGRNRGPVGVAERRAGDLRAADASRGNCGSAGRRPHQGSDAAEVRTAHE